ncbi:hypothetical protein LUZ61_012720 [Rhynchospora tenuis]|uniref:Uncharacterized protein n=1 Tax=Rhynchospora tenuis TaxID=198213 RepID=A0AAD6F1P3_9POAL|nr:hypothetical protein LUZ61_012720 [Rhynchospora tenuis]
MLVRRLAMMKNSQFVTKLLSKSLMRPVNTDPDDDSTNMSMLGESPQTLMKILHKSVMFYKEQKELEEKYKMNSVVAQNHLRCEAMQEKFAENMEQVHAAYQKMGKRCQMMQQEVDALAKDKQELQEKYSEKSRWDPQGPFKPLHAIDPTRVSFILATVCKYFRGDPYPPCGGSILSKTLAQLRADVSGIDAVKKNIASDPSTSSFNSFSVAGSYPSSNEELAVIFEQWMEEHHKTYAQPGEKEHAFKNFIKNYELINRCNADAKKNGGHFCGLNDFSDLSTEEFNHQYLNFKMGKGIEREVVLGCEPNCSCNAPTSLNWKEKGVVTPVENQGRCSSCWAFSATGAIESINAITTGELVSLSKQELIDCVMTSWGCKGGNTISAFRWVIENGGINTETNYPYAAKDGVCSITEASNKMVTIDGYKIVPPEDEALLCALLKQPISVGIAASSDDFHFYREGIFHGKCSNNPDDITHAMLLVGFGSENGTDYWILKNSWGTKWGDKGYMLLKRDKSLPYGKCAILGLPSYPTKTHGSLSMGAQGNCGNNTGLEAGLAQNSRNSGCKKWKDFYTTAHELEKDC